MPCKHEGGTDPCERYSNRHCKVSFKQWYTAERGVRNGVAPADLGQAGEHFVAADLLRKGLRVTKPLNTNGGDDLYVKTSEGWKSVQVKSGIMGKRTMRRPGGYKNRVTSQILALVSYHNWTIDYRSMTEAPLPKELQE